MSTVSPANFAQAQARQQALTDAEWLLRCDELAQSQPVLFMELLTFGRDGAAPAQTRALVDYLSTMQFVAAGVSVSASAPVGMEEFRAAIQRTGHLFHAINTDDRRHFERMIRAWHEGMVQRSEPVVWAGCVATLKQHGILSAPLMKDMVVTLCAIADVFSRRLRKNTPSCSGAA